MTPVDAASERLLLLMPTVTDAEFASSLLHEAGVESTVCTDLAGVCRELRAGAGALLLTDEAPARDSSGQFAEAMRDQPPWSALPVLMLAREGSARQLELNTPEWLRGLTIVERPVRARTLISIVLSALRGRRDQYQIRDAMAQLANQAEQLRSADRRKDEFLATLAHELRNPLAPIQTGLDLLERAHSAATEQRTMTVMRRQLRHMVRMIDDLLDVSRITQGKLELKRSSVRLNDVLDVAVEASRPLIEGGHHTLRREVEEPDLTFEADQTRIAQVVSNLLNNASKFTKEGGLIELFAYRNADELVVEVRDNGIGIRAQELSHVFDLFSQPNREVVHGQGGLGIGLSLVRSLVEMHHGSVEARSPGAGQGSSFIVRLPLGHERSPINTPPHPTQAPPTRDRKRVLVVDDNDDAAELLEVMLHDDYDTSVANDGPSALALAERFTPDVVILDIGLPGMSGHEVARELRKRPSAHHLELIALTGWGSQEDRQRALDAGFDLHLTKPVDRDKLYGALAEVLA